MSDVAIRVDNLSKLYRLGETAERYNTLRDSIAKTAAAPFRRLWRANGSANGKKLSHQDDQLLWALKDVSFEVKRGEVLGIIGRNGAGKSTLLKVLSRITEPTEGAIDLYGRVASLLEVGTGFHPELTGRENIFLNGSILGMSHREIKGKFDEIVDFAGVERFIDTPVKRYSSGMGVRLGFSVAAHLEPEILIVDEVLAVGDAEFQRKCLGKMEDVGRSGRTVLFVSHNMIAVQNLCTEVIVLDRGGVAFRGKPLDATSYYYRGCASKEKLGSYTADDDDNPPDNQISISHANVKPADAKLGQPIYSGSPLSFQIYCQVPPSAGSLSAAIGINSFGGLRIATIRLEERELLGPKTNSSSLLKLSCTVSDLHLSPGTYSAKLLLSSKGFQPVVVDPAFIFTTEPSNNTKQMSCPRKSIVMCSQEWALDTNVNLDMQTLSDNTSKQHHADP